LNIAIVDKEIEPEPIVSTAFAVLNGLGFIVPRYLWITLRSSYFISCVEEKMRGQAYPAINDGDLAPLPIPLPPLAEQRRIVAKVDDLMKLCDELEAAQAKRERRRDRLVAATLHGLNNGEANDENGETLSFEDSASFYLNHLMHLTTHPEYIEQLRQTILNLAVRGKLVPQDPKDEPASEYLKRVELEKRRLIDQGTIKRDRLLPKIADDEVPFSVPSSWAWERFANVAAIQSNLVKPQDYPKHPHIAPDNIESMTGKLLPYETVAESKVFSAKHLFLPGRIIYSKIRPNLAKVAIVNFEGLCSADAYPIYPLIIIEYLHKFMLSEVFVRQSIKEDNRVAMPKINQEALSIILVAVPPLAEQQRIVAKVDELMKLCDEVGTRITTTSTIRRQLLEATLQEALAS
jgi:type I restriction enzyme S subunit